MAIDPEVSASRGVAGCGCGTTAVMCTTCCKPVSASWRRLCTAGCQCPPCQFLASTAVQPHMYRVRSGACATEWRIRSVAGATAPAQPHAPPCRRRRRTGLRARTAKQHPSHAKATQHPSHATSHEGSRHSGGVELGVIQSVSGGLCGGRGLGVSAKIRQHSVMSDGILSVVYSDLPANAGETTVMRLQAHLRGVRRPCPPRFRRCRHKRCWLRQPAAALDELHRTWNISVGRQTDCLAAC